MIDESPDDVAGYTAQAREFLVKGRQYLAAGDLHQASEKGCDAATHMAKAVALAQGWPYTRHDHFHQTMNRASRMLGNEYLSLLHGRAEILHANLYELKEDLDAGIISEDLDYVSELVELMYPLTGRP